MIHREMVVRMWTKKWESKTYEVCVVSDHFALIRDGSFPDMEKDQRNSSSVVGIYLHRSLSYDFRFIVQIGAAMILFGVSHRIYC